MKKLLLGIALMLYSLSTSSQYVYNATQQSISLEERLWVYTLAREAALRKEANEREAALKKEETIRNILTSINNMKQYVSNALGKNIDETLRKQLNDDYQLLNEITSKIRLYGITNDIWEDLEWVSDDISDNVVSYNNRIAKAIKEYEEAQQKEAAEIAMNQEWTGTGFALNKGYIVTNYHVVENAKGIMVQGVQGSFDTEYNAVVVAIDKYNDIAIIKIEDNQFNGFGNIPYSVDMQMAEVGDDVFVLGYPLTQTMGDEIKLTNGIISSRTGFQGDVSLYQMTAPVQPGNSGGPMFNSKGNVVGIVCAQHTGTDNVGYAIKTSYLRNLAESSSLTSIFPKNNKVSTLPLSGKVKSLKKFVYLIKCSNKTESRPSLNSTSVRSFENKKSAPASTKVVDLESQNIQVETSTHIFVLTKIEVTESYTKLYKKVIPKIEQSYICSDMEQYIEDATTGEKYYLQNSTIDIAPSRTILYSSDKVEFVETYPRLKNNTKFVYISTGKTYYGNKRIITIR